MARVSIRDIANKANVSIATVSLAFNKPEQLAVETLQRILSISQDMGYRPNSYAVSMKSRMKIIAIAIPYYTIYQTKTTFFLHNTIQKLLEKQYQVSILYYHTIVELSQTLAILENNNSISGVFVLEDKEGLSMPYLSLPTIFIGSSSKTKEFSSIQFDLESVITLFFDNSKEDKRKFGIIFEKMFFETPLGEKIFYLFQQVGYQYDQQITKDFFCLLHKDFSDQERIICYNAEFNYTKWIVWDIYSLYLLNNLYPKTEIHYLGDSRQIQELSFLFQPKCYDYPHESISQHAVELMLRFISSPNTSPNRIFLS